MIIEIRKVGKSGRPGKGHDVVTCDTLAAGLDVIENKIFAAAMRSGNFGIVERENVTDRGADFVVTPACILFEQQRFRATVRG